MRRLTIILALIATLTVQPAGAVTAERAAPLPPDRILFDSNRTGNYELFTMGEDGSTPVQLTSDPRYDSWWPKLSPDRTEIAFQRTPKGVHDRDYKKTSVWRMRLDGTGLREIIPLNAYGWDLLGHVEWSPDGTELLLFGGGSNSPQIFITTADGTSPVQVTHRPGTNLDPSWSPDGRIVFIGCPSRICAPSQYEVYVADRDGRNERRLTSDGQRDHDPYSSPDGRSIAWLRQTVGFGIFIMDADGSDQRPVINDVAISSKPAWSEGSDWIYFHRTSLGRTGFNVFKIRPDGTGRAELVARPVIGLGPYGNEYPVASSF